MLSSKSNSGNMCDTMWSQVRQVWYNIKTANSGSIQTMPTQQIGSKTLVNQVWHNSKTETHLASPSPPALHTKTTSCYLSQIKWRGLDEQNQIDQRTKKILCPVDQRWKKRQTLHTCLCYFSQLVLIFRHRARKTMREECFTHCIISTRAISTSAISINNAFFMLFTDFS